MKMIVQSWCALALLVLSACQAGKIADQKSSALNQTANPTNTSTIDLGNMSAGPDLGVEANPTPVPPSAPSGTSSSSNTPIKHETLFTILRIVTSFSSDAFASTTTLPDTYQFYSSADLLAKLGAVVGNDLVSFQNQYSNYLSASLTNPSTPIPSGLQKMVTLSFTTSNGKTSSLVLPLIAILSSNASVITYSTYAYYGVGLIPAASSLISPAPLANLSGAKYLKVGSALKIVGGLIGGSVLNRNIATVTFDNVYQNFTISTSPTSLSATLANAVLKPISSSVAAAAGLTPPYVGNYALIANINSSNKIYGFSLLNLASGVITSSSASCSSMVSYFPGYTCSTTGNTSVSLPN